jgi:hypothetical protein
MRWWPVLAFAPLTVAAFAAEPQRELSEACQVVSQQRNSLADAIAVVEARRKLLQERVAEWEAYFKAYLGE